MKVLYICPFAHYSGHPPFAAMNEPRILQDNGCVVTLLTFCGIIQGMESRVKHINVLPSGHWLHGYLKWIRTQTIARWVLMLLETVLTIGKAVRLRKRYDVFHLRDGEPFLFISHITSLPFKNIKWAVSLTASNLYSPYIDKAKAKDNMFLWLYVTMLGFVNGAVWRPLYRISIKRNRFMFMTQNEIARKGYSKYQNSVFDKIVKCVPLCVNGLTNHKISKQAAREHLKLPKDKTILLSFGAPHSGKDLECVFKATSDMEDVLLIHAGIQAFSLGSNPVKLAEKYHMIDRVKVYDYYIPEKEKPYYFYASDALLLSYTKEFKSTSSMLWEAVKYRLPVISSHANTLGDDVKAYNLGMLFRASDDKSLRSVIRRYIHMDGNAKSVFTNNCESFSEDFSSEIWAGRCKAIYNEL